MFFSAREPVDEPELLSNAIAVEDGLIQDMHGRLGRHDGTLAAPASARERAHPGPRDAVFLAD